MKSYLSSDRYPDEGTHGRQGPAQSGPQSHAAAPEDPRDPRGQLDAPHVGRRHLQLAARSNEDIGLATVYRVLTQFEGAGLVTRHHFEDGMAVFEINQGAHHDHIVCLDCGRVEEFMDAGIEERQKAVAAKLGVRDPRSLADPLRPLPPPELPAPQAQDAVGAFLQVLRLRPRWLRAAPAGEVAATLPARPASRVRAHGPVPTSMPPSMRASSSMRSARVSALSVVRVLSRR